MISWWKFENNYLDSYGSNDGSCSNCPTYISSGQVGGAFDFDGSDDYVGISNTDLNNGFSSISISSWIYLNGWGGGSYGRFVSLKNDSV